MGKKTKKTRTLKKKSLKGGEGFGDEQTKFGSKNPESDSNEYGGITFPDYNINSVIKDNNIEISIDKGPDMSEKIIYSFWIFEEKNPIPINSDMEFADKKKDIDLKQFLYTKEDKDSIFINPRNTEIDEDEDDMNQEQKIELKKYKNKDFNTNYVYTDFSENGKLVCTPLLNKFTDIDNNPTVARLGDEVLGTVDPSPSPKPGTLIQSNTGKKIPNFNFYSCLTKITVKPYNDEEKEVSFTEKEIELPSPSPNPKKIKRTKKLLECSIPLPEKIEIPTHKYEFEFDESLDRDKFKCEKYPHLINYYEPQCDISRISDSFDLVSERREGAYPTLINIQNEYDLKEYLNNDIENKPNFKLLVRLILPNKDTSKKPYVKFIQILNDNSKLTIKKISKSMRPDESIIKIIGDNELLLNPYKREWDDDEYYKIFDGILKKNEIKKEDNEKKEVKEVGK
jgi:hypothetical protein